jgi:hypothetical protein
MVALECLFSRPFVSSCAADFGEAGAGIFLSIVNVSQFHDNQEFRPKRPVNVCMFT